MKSPILCLFLVALLFSSASAAILPPEKLLPQDTVLVMTVPDSQAARASWSKTPFAQLSQDPAMKAFQDKFLTKFNTDVVDPIEREFGFKFADYKDLAQGQFTFALLPAQTPEKNSPVVFSQLLLVDSRDNSDKLTKTLAELKKKWIDAGKQFKTEKIRDIECTTLAVSDEELSKSWQKMFPSEKRRSAKQPKNSAVQTKSISLAQLGSLLMVSDSPDAIEKVIARQSGSLLAPLEENSVFHADYTARLRPAQCYCWVNAKPFLKLVLDGPSPSDRENPFGLNPDAVVDALGLSAVRSVSFSVEASAEGTSSQLFINLPESERRGLFKVLAADAKDSAPPPFVPADAIKFSRWRLNLPQSWATLESTLNEISPALSGALNFILQNAGKDKDEKFSIKDELFGNLGSDLIDYEKAPPGDAMADADSAPSLFLIGSPNPEKLALTLKIALSSVVPVDAAATERDFMGRKIYSLPSISAARGKSARPIAFAAAGGYVAFSSDTAMLEEFLRNPEANPKPLSGTPSLAEAAQKVGGMNTGLFGYGNQKEATRVLLKVLRKEPSIVASLIGTSFLPANTSPPEQLEKMEEWLDFSLLPPFESIEKYFGFSVYAGSFDRDGFSLRHFAPAPPASR